MRRSLMLRTLYFFIVECGIACFLRAMHVFEVLASSSSLGYLCAKFRFFCGFHCCASLWRKMEYSLTQSITQLIWCPGTEAKASGGLQSVVATMQVIFFIVECGIARFLGAMRVFEVRNHPHPLDYLCAKCRFVHVSVAELAHGEKSRNHSITKLIWRPGNRSFRFGITAKNSTLLHYWCSH